MAARLIYLEATMSLTPHQSRLNHVACVLLLASSVVAIHGCCCPAPPEGTKNSKKTRVPHSATFLASPEEFMGFSATPDGRVLATIDLHAADVWDGETGAHERSVEFSDEVLLVALSSNGLTLAVLTHENGDHEKATLHIIDTRTGEARHRHSIKTHDQGFDRLFLLDEGRLAFIERHDAPCTLMETESAVVKTLEMHGAPITRGDECAVDPQHEKVACVWGDNDRPGAEFIRQTLPVSVTKGGPSGPVRIDTRGLATNDPRALAFVPGRRRGADGLLAAAFDVYKKDRRDASQVRIYSLKTGEVIKTLKVPDSRKKDNIVNSLHASPDGRFLLVFSNERMHVWDMSTWRRTTKKGFTVFDPVGWLPGREAKSSRLLVYDSPRVVFFEIRPRKNAGPKVRRLRRL